MVGSRLPQGVCNKHLVQLAINSCKEGSSECDGWTHTFLDVWSNPSFVGTCSTNLFEPLQRVIGDLEPVYRHPLVALDFFTRSFVRVSIHVPFLQRATKEARDPSMRALT